MDTRTHIHIYIQIDIHIVVTYIHFLKITSRDTHRSSHEHKQFYSEYKIHTHTLSIS